MSDREQKAGSTQSETSSSAVDGATKSSPTLGPWYVQGLQVDPHGIIRVGGFEIVTEAYDVVGGNPGVAPIRNEADARLIAAAPDLLEALESLLIATNDVMAVNNEYDAGLQLGELEQAANVAIAAMAKAVEA